MRQALALAALIALASCASGPKATQEPAVPGPLPPQPKKEDPLYPPTRAENIEETLHGEKVKDSFRWLEQVETAEVQAWMKAQDTATREKLAKLPGRDALAKRFKELYYVESVSAPTKRANRFFFMRTHVDQDKAILYFKDGEAGDEKILLDPNKWSLDGTISLGHWVPSWDGKRVVFAEKPNAADEATLKVIDVDTLELSRVDSIEGGKYANPAWTPDGKGFYYERLPVDPKIPVAERPGYTEIYFHVLGEDPAKDVKIHEKTGNPSTFLSTGLSRDGRYLFAVIARGWNENDVFMRDLKKDKEFKPLILGKDATYEVDVWKDDLYILTNEGASNMRVFKASAQRPDRKLWREIVKEDKDAALQNASIVGGQLVLRYLKHASSELRVVTLEGKPVRTITLPGIGTTGDVHGLQDEDEGYFDFSSYTVPQQVYKVSMKTGKVDLFAKVTLPIDPTPYEVEQVFYPSKDKTKISMFLVHRKDWKKDSSNAVYLYGYGGFNVSLTPAFRGGIYPLLEAGGVYAVPNLRGGGEYGKKWHDAGRLHVKQNVFDDFIGAAEYLIAEKITQPAKLAISGGSNGGLLTGAAFTQRPDLFGAVVCSVPLLDMVRFHLFGSGKTWVPEYGSAENAEDFKALYAYSPYHRVKPGTAYPPLLMMSADHDDRVDPMHARKFVAAVQAASTSKQPVYLRIEANAGHGGSDQVKKAIQSSADQFAFVFQHLGLKVAEAPAK